MFLGVLLCSGQLPKKELVASRLNGTIKLDGILDEDAWNSASIASAFVQRSPDPGEKHIQPTEVRVLYDDAALYVGAYMREVHADSVLRQLSRRDQVQNADWFALALDPYQTGFNGFVFKVTAAGVQIDENLTVEGGTRSWNAVWYSEVQVNDSGWVAELKVPFSAFRFAKQEEQEWSINFGRDIRRVRQEAWWNAFDPRVDGFFNQAGILKGIQAVDPPVRLMFYPYVSSYMEHHPDRPEGSDMVTKFNGGMDLKYGINDAFTLDMTVVPDFNTALSDNLVLNLSPFEVRYNENRQFFTEGTELFDRGDLFYTRRVGAQPIFHDDVEDQVQDDEEVVENPQEARLINALKVSGRNQNGLGVGIFNAITNNEFAKLRNEEGETRKILANPLTNYNVLVLDQVLKNNSYVTLINTNVLRDGSAYDANVTGTELQFRDKANRFQVSGDGALSQIFRDGNTELGHRWGLDVAKIGGAWEYGVGYSMISDTYDPNDLGFLLFNNQQDYTLDFSYTRYTPWWKLNRFWWSNKLLYTRLYNPDTFTDFVVQTELGVYTRKFLFTEFQVTLEPIETYDYFEPREPGRFYAYPKNYKFSYVISTDYRKRFAIDVRTNYRNFDEPGRQKLFYAIEPRFRANDKLSFIAGFEQVLHQNDIGWVNTIEEGIILGRRDRTITIPTLNAEYIFTKNMALRLRMRHYWQQVEYNKYFLLEEDGRLGETSYIGLDDDGQSSHNNNFNTFNIDLIYTWVFAPGSELSFVWKNAILTESNQLTEDYWTDIQETLEAPQTNSFSLKVLYFLDYLSLKRKR